MADRVRKRGQWNYYGSLHESKIRVNLKNLESKLQEKYGQDIRLTTRENNKKGGLSKEGKAILPRIIAYLTDKGLVIPDHDIGDKLL